MNLIDCRALNHRLEGLLDIKQDLNYEGEELGDEYLKELEELEYIKREVPDFERGITLIPEDEFTEYCKEQCEELGNVSIDLPWYVTIDWEDTARNMSADYSKVEYQGNDYYFLNI